MKNLISALHGLVEAIAAIGLVLGFLIWLFFGLMDITNTSGIGLETNHVLVGAIGICLFIINAIALYLNAKEKLGILMVAAATLIVLSVAFSHFSPVRIGALFGRGDPAQYAALWSGVTGLLLIVRVVLYKVKIRSL